MSSTGSGSELRAIAEERVGTTLRERWQLESVLGVGGMAAVYAARHRNGSRVAIKMLHPMLSHHEAVRTRFLAEGRAANAVEHDGVVHVLDDDVTADGCAFQVMELLEGDTLDALGRQRGRALELSTIVDLIDQLLDALAAAHTIGIVHRDIKPQNVFVTRAGQVKVLDFGIARLHEPTDGGQQTRTGMLMGTPAFMAPEQALGRWRLVDGQSDVWAVGASMYWLLTGKLVHIGETFQEVLVQAARDRAPSLAAVLPGADPGLVTIVDKALAFDKALRWKDAREMQSALRAWKTRGAPAEAPLPTTLPLQPFVAGDDSTVDAGRATDPLVMVRPVVKLAAPTEPLRAPLFGPPPPLALPAPAPLARASVPAVSSPAVAGAWPALGPAGGGAGQTSVPFSSDTPARAVKRPVKLGLAAGLGLAAALVLFVALRGPTDQPPALGAQATLEATSAAAPSQPLTAAPVVSPAPSTPLPTPSASPSATARPSASSATPTPSTVPPKSATTTSGAATTKPKTPSTPAPAPKPKDPAGRFD